MSDDDPDYSCRAARRQRVVPIVANIACVSSLVSLRILLKSAFDLLGPFPTWVISLALAVLLLRGMEMASGRLHRSLWPEHPEDHDR